MFLIFLQALHETAFSPEHVLRRADILANAVRLALVLLLANWYGSAFADLVFSPGSWSLASMSALALSLVPAMLLALVVLPEMVWGHVSRSWFTS